ncbi:MAG: ABC transporter permease [Chloroflexi bacterium]|nr:ABC transporter permease [Chloroflexota bacterium]
MSAQTLQAIQAAHPKRIMVVDSEARFAPSALLQLWEYRELVFALTQREIKARYRQSLLGIGWAIVQPLAFMVVFSLVFGRFARLPSDGLPYPIFSYTALVPWTFLANALTTATIGLVSQRSVVTKTYFPREVIVISQVGARFVDFLAAALVLAGMLVWYGITPTAWLLLVPVLVLVQVMLILGLSLITSALHVSFRDIAPVVTLGLQVWLYLTPVSYALSLVRDAIPAALWPIYMLNPMVGIIDAFRSAVAHGRAPDWSLLGVSTVMSIIILVVAYLYFKRAERAFADII